MVFAPSPVTEEGESYPEVNPKNEKNLLKSKQKAQGRSYEAFSHSVMRLHESKTRRDAEDVIRKIEAVLVCYVERDMTTVSGERIMYAIRPEDLAVEPPRQILPIRYPTEPPTEWKAKPMSSLTELKQSETQGDFPLDEAQGHLEWEDVIGKSFSEKKLMDIHSMRRISNLN